MIVWGGFFFFDGSTHYFNTGGRYNPSTDSWTATSTTNAPDGRRSHTAVWTDSEMIVWGGGLSRPCEKWWQILRHWTEPDTHANAFSDPNRDRYANCHSNGNSDTNSPPRQLRYGNADSHRNSDGDCNCNCHTDCDSASIAYSDGDSNIYADCNSNCNCNADRLTANYTDAQTSTDASTEALA